MQKMLKGRIRRQSTISRLSIPSTVALAAKYASIRAARDFGTLAGRAATNLPKTAASLLFGR